VTERPELEFVPMSTDLGKIRFFGTLMPALLLLRASPTRFVRSQLAGLYTPRQEIGSFIAAGTDDAGQVGDTWLFVHRWKSERFDPFAFADAKLFLRRIARMVARAGCSAEPLDPLSPLVNLPRLAAGAGLGNLSPFGLLVHPEFGPRLILTGLRTDHPLRLEPRWGGSGCTDCMTCLEECPQEPLAGGVVRLGECQSCTECLAVCPTGKD
jgi:ferredoxin